MIAQSLACSVATGRDRQQRARKRPTARSRGLGLPDTVEDGSRP